MRLYLMRHMQTACSAAGLHCGNCPVELTPNGQRMAQACSRYLCAIPFAAIYSSDMRRAQQTAAPLAALLGLPVQPLAAWRELGYGSWDGLSVAAVRAANAAEGSQLYAQWEQDPSRVAPPGGETATQVAERAVTAVMQLRRVHAGGGAQPAVLVVSHKATIRLLLCRFLGIADPFYRARFAQPWGAVNCLEFGDNLAEKTAQLIYMGDNHYLRGLPEAAPA